MLLPVDTALTRKFRYWSFALSSFVLLLSLIVLAGWHLDVPLLRKMGSPVAAMNPVTAICFLLAAIGLLLVRADALHLL